MPTVVRALLDREPPPTLLMLWRDRDIIGPLLGLLMVGVVLRDLAHRINRPTLGSHPSGLETWRGDRADPALVWLARHQTDTTD